jgi:hypothetical protein
MACWSAIGVDPGHLPTVEVCGCVPDTNVDHVFLMPELFTGADLDMEDIIWDGEHERPVAEGLLNSDQLDAGCLAHFLKGPVELVATLVADRV